MKAFLLLAALLALAGCGRADTPATPKAANCTISEAGALRIENAWVRTQKDVSATSAAYFTLCNAGTAPVTIEAITTPAAGIVELHESTRDANGVVSMAPIGLLTLMPGEQVTFEPGGKHAMLMNLAAPIAEGTTTVLALKLTGGGAVTTEAKAVPATRAAARTHPAHTQ
ncbi:MAG TPA: hypothetical protein DDZ68_06660 [Parvularcula sp.]|nr:hypothetical protein [Parvularcula sp.]HBS30480.1 hypothetical protein [Parvularcula sp.]